MCFSGVFFGTFLWSTTENADKTSVMDFWDTFINQTKAYSPGNDNGYVFLYCFLLVNFSQFIKNLDHFSFCNDIRFSSTPLKTEKNCDIIKKRSLNHEWDDKSCGAVFGALVWQVFFYSNGIRYSVAENIPKLRWKVKTKHQV